MSQFFHTPRTLASAVLAIAVLAACGQTQQPAAPAAADKSVPAPVAVAVVNGSTISRAELRHLREGFTAGQAAGIDARAEEPGVG